MPSSVRSSASRALNAAAAVIRSASVLPARSAALIVSNTPLIGARGRYLRNKPRKPRHSPALRDAFSAESPSSWRTYRPAVSINTASLVNHQSQCRVPPLPGMAIASADCPICSAKGNCRPALSNAVVLPSPGAPIIIYHGNSYR